jgi:putative aminopeptidase FrvX
MKLDLEFLKKYINTPSPSGYEMQLGGQKVWIEYVKQFADRVETDSYGNAYAYYGSDEKIPMGNNNLVVLGGRKAKTVLIDAHADEIGFFVSDVTKEGFIKIGTLGGSDITIAPSSRVDIWLYSKTNFS